MKVSSKIILLVIIILVGIKVGNVNAVLKLDKADSFTSAYPDIVHDGAPYQRRILYSNMTNYWYVFYTTSNHVTYTGAVLYAIYESDGTLVSYDNVFYGDLSTIYSDVLDYDVAINRNGNKVYLVFSQDLNAGNNAFNNADKETLRWVYFEVLSNGLLNETSKQLLSSLAVQPFTDINRYENVQMSVLYNGYQVISFGSKDGTVYSAWLMINNETVSFNLRYGFNPESLEVDFGNNPSNVYYHSLTVGNFNKSGISFVLIHRDTNFYWDFFGASCNNIMDEINVNNDYVYNGYTQANWINQGIDTTALQTHQSSLGRNSPTASFSYDGTIHNDIYVNSEVFRSWVYNKTDNDFNKHKNILGSPSTYVLQYAYAFEDGRISMIYAQNTKRWYERDYDFTIDNWNTNYSILKMNSQIDEAKGKADYGSSLKAYGYSGWNDFSLVSGALSVIDDTYSGGGNVTFYVDKDFVNPLAPHIVVAPTVTDLIGNQVEWLFMGEPYQVQMTVNNTRYAYIQFGDTVHIIRFRYNETKGDFFDAVVTANDELYVVGLQGVDVVKTGTVYALTWKFILNKQIVDAYNTTWTYYLSNDNKTNLLTAVGTLSQTPSIYNVGGRVGYRKTGSSQMGRMVGGESFEVYARKDIDVSTIRAFTVFRKLQAVHLLYEFNHNGTWNGVTGRWDNIQGESIIRFGLDVLINGSWFNPIEMEIEHSSNRIGHSLGGKDISDLKLSINWYVEGVLIRLGDKITTYDHSYFSQGDSQSGRLTYQAWVDLWFNMLNGSTVIGGRINPYYYAMYEKGWWGFGSFSPDMSNVTYAMFFNDLKVNNTIMSSQEIELVRFYVEVRNLGAQDLKVNFEPFEILDYKLASDRMQGVPTPVLVDTKVIVMPNTGFVNPIVRAIQGIGKFIGNALFGFVQIMIGGIDALLVVLGLPEGMFSSLINFVTIQITTVFSWLNTVIDNVDDMLYVFISMMNWILTFMGYILNGITWIILWVLPIPIHLVRFVIALLTSSEFTYMGFTFDFSSGKEIMEAGYQILPYTLAFMFATWLFLGEGDESDNSDIFGTPRRVVYVFKMLKDTYLSIFWFFNHAMNEIMRMYNFIRSHIPFLNAGGGETEE
jgi:hypothetical protein